MPALRLPAEWEPQAGVLLSWPTSRTDWRDVLDGAEQSYLAAAMHICRQAIAYICCQDEQVRNRVSGLLDQADIAADRWRLLTIPYDDTWIRDYGPITVVDDGQPVWLDFRFNAWGGKYPCQRDNAATAKIHECLFSKNYQYRRVDMVLEGGSIDSDGQGTLLTTSRCLLNRNRNGTRERSQVEAMLADHLGARRVLWLTRGALQGDDTDAHIDTLARFCSADRIAYVSCDDENDPHYPELRAMRTELERLSTASGIPYELVPLPLPTPCHDSDGRRLAASYANFLIVNQAVLLPVYGVESDALAAQRIATAFPEHQVITIPCRALLEQNGSLHCATMQIPSVQNGESSG
jgi:agmatine/peptidylarginine deiminase